MKFQFRDITNESIYDSARILFVFGPYSIFNNIAIDEVRDRCKPKEIAVLSPEMLEDFGDIFNAGESRGITVSNTVTFDEFKQVINAVSMYGKWFTSIDYSFMSKKQKDWLNVYMKAPSDNGKIVIYCSEYRDYRILLKNKIITNSNMIHAIQLSFPYRDTLEAVVNTLFEARNVKIEKAAVELFIMRMSSSYDDYEEIIDKIVTESVPDKIEGQDPNWVYTITYRDTLDAMKGIENFVLDDFIDKLLVPLKTDKQNAKNKVYKMLNALLEEYGAQQLVNKLKFKVDDYIEFRIAINNGIIPIQIMKFSVQDSKKRLPEESKLLNFSDYTFRKMALIASRTSLTDWMYMKLILNNARYQYDSTSYERVLYSLINRTILNESRLNNAIGIENIMNIGINEIDSVPYTLDIVNEKGD